MPVYIEKSGDLVGCHHSKTTTEKGKIELLSQWNMEGWDEQFIWNICNTHEFYQSRCFWKHNDTLSNVWIPIEKRLSDNGASSFWLDESSQRQRAKVPIFVVWRLRTFVDLQKLTVFLVHQWLLIYVFQQAWIRFLHQCNCNPGGDFSLEGSLPTAPSKEGDGPVNHL